MGEGCVGGFDSFKRSRSKKRKEKKREEEISCSFSSFLIGTAGIKNSNKSEDACHTFPPLEERSRGLCCDTPVTSSHRGRH